MREEKRASHLWTPFTANRRYYLVLRRARYATYAVTRRLVDVCRASAESLSDSGASLSFTAAPTLLTGVLGRPWDGILRWRWYPRSHRNSSFTAKFSSTAALHACCCTCRARNRRKVLLSSNETLPVTTLELELSALRCEEEHEESKSIINRVYFIDEVIFKSSIMIYGVISNALHISHVRLLTFLQCLIVSKR